MQQLASTSELLLSMLMADEQLSTGRDMVVDTQHESAIRTWPRSPDRHCGVDGVTTRPALLLDFSSEPPCSHKDIKMLRRRREVPKYFCCLVTPKMKPSRESKPPNRGTRPASPCGFERLLARRMRGTTQASCVEVSTVPAADVMPSKQCEVTATWEEVIFHRP